MSGSKKAESGASKDQQPFRSLEELLPEWVRELKRIEAEAKKEKGKSKDHAAGGK